MSLGMYLEYIEIQARFNSSELKLRPALPALARQKLYNAQGRKTRSGPGALRAYINLLSL